MNIAWGHSSSLVWSELLDVLLTKRKPVAGELLLLLAFAGLAGCNTVPGNSSEVEASDSLETATIGGVHEDPMKLREGRYEGEPFVLGGASRPTVTLLAEPRAHVDVDGVGSSTMVARILLLIAVALLTACAASPGPVPMPETAAAESDVPGEPEAIDDAEEAHVIAEEKAPLLDRTQARVENVVKSTAQVVDNIFGSTEVEEEASVTRGRLAVGGQWEERDGLTEQRLRLKARFRLPALKNRTSFFIGRGDADDFVDGSADDNIDTLPNRFNDFQDEDWLLGIGYSRDARLRRGWSFGAGVRVSTPLEPFVRATYRWNRAFGDDWLWRVEPRVFVQSQRGAGISLQSMLDHVLSDTWLLRSYSIAVAEEDVEGVSWTSKLIAYQSLSTRHALSYAAYGTGETDYEVPLRDYGLEVRYRRQISREWLFVELLTYVHWPRDFLVEQRERNVGVGIEFEMQFGDWPGRPAIPR